MNYKKYLDTNHWKKTRSKLLLDLGYSRSQAILLCKTGEIGIDFMRKQLLWLSKLEVQEVDSGKHFNP